MIHSMTAFASGNSQNTWGNITWDIRSVNHRFCDCTIKLPETFKGLEMELRDIVRQEIKRGRIECSLQYKPLSPTDTAINVNKNLVQELARACGTVQQLFPITSNPNPLQILSWPGVLQSDEINVTALNTTVIELFKKTLRILLECRSREGSALQKLLIEKLHAIAINIEQIKERLPSVITTQRDKLLSKLRDMQIALDTHRLEQEMVFFAQKIDICEEVERLTTHIAETHNALQQQESAGKRLDFLLQELNRETNTIMSKSVDAEITKIALNIKVFIEQMREQVQNIE